MRCTVGKNPGKFAKFMGRRQGEIFDDPRTRLGCRLWLERVLGSYGEDGGVDVEIVDVQLGLCSKTADYLYSGFTPPRSRYVRGSRPLLEQTVAEVVKPGMTGREKSLALMRRCRDNRRRGLARGDLFAGGTEEELLKLGAIQCNYISRVFVCLCQVAGMPARTFSSHISGHMMAEVCADGKWAWIDPMFGLAPVNDDDTPASAWELLQDSKLFERQPKRVWDHILPPQATLGNHERDRRNLMYWMARFRDCYFNPLEAAALGNYFVWEHNRYTYPWSLGSASPARLKEGVRREALNRKAMGWPDYYFNPLLFNETLKPR